MSLDSAFAGRYRIVRLLGHGGMAAVYLAHQEGIGGFTKKVALKIVHEHLASQRQFTRYFINEARLGGYLLHPNIVQTLDFGEVDGRVFLAMEYVDGLTVQQILRRCRDRGVAIPVGAALSIVIGVCQALDFAHTAVDHHNERLNMIHRDLKPSNILVSRFGHVKLGDFGVARAECNLDRTLVSGTLKGTVRYMSPEQAWGVLDLDHRADLFAVGLVLFELLAMEHLYDAKGTEPAIRQAQEADVAHRLPAVPAGPVRDDLIAFLRKALARDPGDRFQSAGAMADQLTRIQGKLGATVTLRDWLSSLFPPDDQDKTPGGGSSTREPRKASQGSTVLLFRSEATEQADTGVESDVPEAPDQPAMECGPPPSTSPAPLDPADDLPTETLSLKASPAAARAPGVAPPRAADPEEGPTTAVIHVDIPGAATVPGQRAGKTTGTDITAPTARLPELEAARQGTDISGRPARDTPGTPAPTTVVPEDNEEVTTSPDETAAPRDDTRESDSVTIRLPGTLPEKASTNLGQADDGDPAGTGDQETHGPAGTVLEGDNITIGLPDAAGETAHAPAPRATQDETPGQPSMGRRRLALAGVAMVVGALIWAGVSLRRPSPFAEATRRALSTPVATARGAQNPGRAPGGTLSAVTPTPDSTPGPATTPPSLPDTPAPATRAVTSGAHPRPAHRFGWLNAASLPASTISLDGRRLDDFPVQDHRVRAGTHTLVFVTEDGRRLEIGVQVAPATKIRCWADFNAGRVTCR